MRSDFLFEAIQHAHAIGFLGRVTVHPFLSLLRLISFYGYWCDLSADAVVSHAAMPRARVRSHTHTHTHAHMTQRRTRGLITVIAICILNVLTCLVQSVMEKMESKQQKLY